MLRKVNELLRTRVDSIIIGYITAFTMASRKTKRIVADMLCIINNSESSNEEVEMAKATLMEALSPGGKLPARLFFDKKYMTLVIASGHAMCELDRLRSVLIPKCEGKIGEPNKEVTEELRNALAASGA